MKENRLELKEKDMFPIQCFFNAISDDSFIYILRNLINGIGASINDCHCQFPEDLDPDEDTFEGVRFSIYEDERILSISELGKIINTVCEEQIKRCPQQKNEIKKIFYYV